MKKTTIPWRKKNLASRDAARVNELDVIERTAFVRFEGQLPDLSSAIGMLRMGDHLGWRPLVIIHSKKTLRKYEEILGIKIREFFPESGPSAQRCAGYNYAQKLSNFWKAVSGEIKVEDRQEIA